MPWQAIDLRSDPDEAEHRGDPGDLVDASHLLAELVHRPAWQADAACRGLGTSKWFPGRGEPLDPAREVCAGCPVSVECAAFAVDAGPLLVGVWSGLSDRGRRQLRRMNPAA